jgi:phage N-6-adenine-methyltransferase
MKTAVSVEWNTPTPLKEDLIQEFGRFDLDPATTEENPMNAFAYFTIEEDGLLQPWNAKTVYVNPPYGRIISKWIDKALNEFECGRCEKVVMLLPSRTCTRWFHRLYEGGYEIRFFKGRLRYGDRGPAPFPSILVIIQ